MYTVVDEYGFKMISLGCISKFIGLVHLDIAWISLPLGFSSTTEC
jgi:hypothetical protein